MDMIHHYHHKYGRFDITTAVVPLGDDRSWSCSWAAVDADSSNGYRFTRVPKLPVKQFATREEADDFGLRFALGFVRSTQQAALSPAVTAG